ncbi:MAG: glycosyltransferase family 4 protein [Anaerolineaceae bacterium]|nr:glycosyltransferase family 4 protein [Anaerolineaceae bacterium]
MKIVCISTSVIPSDTANSIQVMKACQALVHLGHSVHLLVPGKETASWDSLADRYGLTTSFAISWLPSHPRWKRNDFAWLAVHRAHDLDADLVYTWTGQSAVFALIRRIPVIFEVHDLPTGLLGPIWFRTFLRLPGRKRLALITRALRAALERRFPALSTQDVIISPNGVDLDQYEDLPGANQSRIDLGLPDTLTVLCSGHLYSGRGVELFLGLAQRFPQVSFVWVGGRPQEVDDYRLRVASAQLSNVIFTGFISQRRLPSYQAAADVLLMPYARSIAGSGGGNSADICSPMKMFDYLAAGRSILTSDLPVIHEVLTEENAVFAPPEDLDGWTDALQRLIMSTNLRNTLSAQSRQDVLGYTWKARAERLLSGFD